MCPNPPKPSAIVAEPTDPFQPLYALSRLETFTSQVMRAMGLEIDYKEMCPSRLEGDANYCKNLDEAKAVHALHSILNAKCAGEADGHYCMTIGARKLNMTLEDFINLPAKVRPLGFVRMAFLSGFDDAYKDAELIFMFDNQEEAVKFRLRYS
jgi:hypothetical protein